MLQACVVDAHSLVKTRVWSATYTPEEVRHIAVALAGVVTSTFHLPPSAAATVNAAAREDYVAGVANLRRDSGIEVAVEQLKKAVGADPDSALTHAGLAEAQWFRYWLTKDQAYLRGAVESLDRAERRNPDLAQVHRVAGVLMANRGKYEDAAAEYRRAIELEPGNSEQLPAAGHGLPPRKPAQRRTCHLPASN